MSNWLHKRSRDLLSLLSDLGGALGFVAAAAALIAAAVAGSALLALEVFPQPFLSLLVLGIALLAAGLTLHFLRGRLTPPPRSAAAPRMTPSQPPDEAHVVGRVIDGNPYSHTAALQREHEIRTRKSLRRIREELRDDRRRVQRAGEGDLHEIRQIRSQAWREEEETLLELTDPEPHSASRQAYRELEGIQDVIYIRESASTLEPAKAAT